MTHPYTPILQMHLAFTEAAILKSRNERDQGWRFRNWRFQFTLLCLTQGLPDPWNFLSSQLGYSIVHMAFPVRAAVSKLGNTRIRFTGNSWNFFFQKLWTTAFTLQVLYNAILLPYVCSFIPHLLEVYYSYSKCSPYTETFRRPDNKTWWDSVEKCDMIMN